MSRIQEMARLVPGSGRQLGLSCLALVLMGAGGTYPMRWPAGEVYRFLEAPDNLAFHLREGTHLHAPEDWEVLLISSPGNGR